MPFGSDWSPKTKPQNVLNFINLLLEMKYREGNGTPLQYSCLGNPMDGGAW